MKEKPYVVLSFTSVSCDLVRTTKKGVGLEFHVQREIELVVPDI